MVWLIVLVVAVILAIVGFVRTSLFRAHLRGHGRDPGEQGTRVEGKYGALGGTYNKSKDGF